MSNSFPLIDNKLHYQTDSVSIGRNERGIGFGWFIRCVCAVAIQKMGPFSF